MAYSPEYETRWAELRGWDWRLLYTTACFADGHTSYELPEYARWSRHDLEKTILRSEFPQEASNG